MTWFHAPAISPEVGLYALISIAIFYALYRMLTYRESPDPHQEAHGEASAFRRERNG